MGLYGSQWVSVGLYGSQWVSVVSMGPHGSLWVPMSHSGAPSPPLLPTDAPRDVWVEVTPPSPILEGHGVTLKCRASSNPAPHNYAWSFNGAALQRYGAQLSLLPHGSDVGLYGCTATNTIGAAESRAVRLEVICEWGAVGWGRGGSMGRRGGSMGRRGVSMGCRGVSMGRRGVSMGRCGVSMGRYGGSMGRYGGSMGRYGAL